MSGTVSGKEEVNNIPPLSLRTGSGARETNIVQDKELLWKNVLLACHRMHDEPYSHFLPIQQHTEEGITLHREDEGPIFHRDYLHLASGQSTFPTHHPRAAPTNSEHHSLSFYLLNLCAHLSSTQVRSNMEQLSNRSLFHRESRRS